MIFIVYTHRVHISGRKGKNEERVHILYFYFIADKMRSEIPGSPLF